MTLIIGMNRPEGVYLSVDYRLTVDGVRVVSDQTPKYLNVTYPPMGGTFPKALFAYTGAAFLPDGTPTGEWFRQSVRGAAEDLGASLTHIRSQLAVARGELPSKLMINFLGVHDGHHVVGELGNVNSDGELIEFRYGWREIFNPIVFTNGVSSSPVADEEAEKLLRIARESDAQPPEVMALIAASNRKVAALPERRVSPRCHVEYLPDPGATDSPEIGLDFDADGVPSSPPPRSVHIGFDVTELAADFMTQAPTLHGNGEPYVPDLNLLWRGFARRQSPGQ